MPQGVIKNISERGYAFAQTQSGDIFCHATHFVGTLFADILFGQTVSFDIGTSKDGRPIAINIEVVQ